MTTQRSIKKILITIEGNIGSGKSTALKKLEEYCKDKNNILFLQEPVDQWLEIKDKDGEHILKKYYNNMQKYSFAFQMMAYISRIHLLKKAIQNPNIDIIISERSVYTDRFVFSQMLYDSNLIEEVEFQIYLKWFNEFLDELPESHIFYVRTDPEVAYERIIKRNRDGENIEKDYIIKCHNYHEKWLYNNNNINELQDKNIIVINGDYDLNHKNSAFKILTNYVKKLENKYFNNNIDDIDDEFGDYDYVMNFDGSSRGNPGLSGAGFVIYKKNENKNEDKKKIYKNGFEFVGIHETNNYAEFYALCIGLITANKFDIKKIKIKGDSLLVINQMKGTWKVKDIKLSVIYKKAKELESKFEKVTYEHVKRDKNEYADYLANLAITSVINIDKNNNDNLVISSDKMY